VPNQDFQHGDLPDSNLDSQSWGTGDKSAGADLITFQSETAATQTHDSDKTFRIPSAGGVFGVEDSDGVLLADDGQKILSEAPAAIYSDSKTAEINSHSNSETELTTVLEANQKTASEIVGQNQPQAQRIVRSYGVNGSFPAELDHWNWGAFLLSWPWALGHRVWIGLLAILPVGPLPLIMAIILGARGNEWAWQNRKFRSIEDFRSTQSGWVRWGAIFALINLFLLAVTGYWFYVMAVNPSVYK
jgi:hypothetical protein